MNTDSRMIFLTRPTIGHAAREKIASRGDIMANVPADNIPLTDEDLAAAAGGVNVQAGSPGAPVLGEPPEPVHGSLGSVGMGNPPEPIKAHH